MLQHPVAAFHYQYPLPTANKPKQSSDTNLFFPTSNRSFRWIIDLGVVFEVFEVVQRIVLALDDNIAKKTTFLVGDIQELLIGLVFGAIELF